MSVATTGTVYAGSRWSSGTSMPSGPATNDRITRTDLGLDFYYDGTRWLSIQVYAMELKIEDVGITWPPVNTQLPVHRGTLPFGTTYDYWLLNWETLSSVVTTNTGSAFWTGNLSKYNSAGGGDTVIATFNTSADSANAAVTKSIAINALLGSFVGFYTDVVKTSTPGAFRFHGGHINCRLVGT